MCTSFTFPHICTNGAPSQETYRNICTYENVSRRLKAKHNDDLTAALQEQLKVLSEQCKVRCATVNMVQAHERCAACIAEQQKLGEEEAAAKCLELSVFSNTNADGYNVEVEDFLGRGADAQWWQPGEGMQYHRSVEEGLDVDRGKKRA